MVQNSAYLSKRTSVKRPRANNKTTINGIICGNHVTWMDMSNSTGQSTIHKSQLQYFNKHLFLFY